MSLLDEIRERMRHGVAPGRPAVNDLGLFWPLTVTPIRIRTEETTKRRLRNAGYAKPNPERDGRWLLTDKGREWLYGAPDSKGDA